jgi:hypothetical protein
MLAVNQALSDRQTWRIQLLVGLIVAVVAAGKMLYIADVVLSDPDTLWHIKVGGDIWRTLSLPVQDTYSFTFSGQPWIAKEWLAQVVFFAAYAANEWNGVVILSGLSVGLTAFLFCREIGKVANPRIAAIITIIAIFLTSTMFVARPQILILPLAVVWTASVFRAAERRAAPSPLLLAILVAWANLHGSFLLGILIAGFAFGHFLETDGFRQRTMVLRWLGFLAGSVLAGIIHPYGAQPFVLAIKMSSSNEWIPMISEWLPFNAKDKPIHEAALLAFFAVLLWARPKLSLSKIAFVLIALHMFLVHQRFIFVGALLAPLAVMGDILRQDSRLSNRTWAEQPRDHVEKFAIERFNFALASLAAIGIILPFVLLRTAAEPPSAIFAGKAIRFAQNSGLSGNVLNDYDFGGSLIFHGIPTFVDGRTDQLFLGKFATTLAETRKSEGAETFVRQLDEYKIDWTLLRKVDARNLVLGRLPLWQRAYGDSDATIYQRVHGSALGTDGRSTEARSDTR